MCVCVDSLYVHVYVSLCVCLECYKQTLSSAFKVWHKQWQLLQLPHPAVHNCTPRDVKLRHTLEAVVAPPTSPSSTAVAIVCACLRAGQFFPLLPIIFTKKLHTKCATLQRPPSATSAAALPLNPVGLPPAYGFSLATHLLTSFA